MHRLQVHCVLSCVLLLILVSRAYWTCRTRYLAALPVRAAAGSTRVGGTGLAPAGASLPSGSAPSSSSSSSAAPRASSAQHQQPMALNYHFPAGPAGAPGSGGFLPQVQQPNGGAPAGYQQPYQQPQPMQQQMGRAPMQTDSFEEPSRSAGIGLPVFNARPPNAASSSSSAGLGSAGQANVNSAASAMRAL